MPPQSASPPDEGVTLWVIFSAAGAGVALAAFVVGFFLGKKGAKSQAEDATQSSRSKSSRKIPSKKPPPPPPSTRSSTMKDKLPSEVQGQPFFCETIADDDKDLEANAQRQGEHRREDSRARSSSRPRREDGRSRSRSRSRHDPTNERRRSHSRSRSHSQRRVPNDSLALSPTADLSEASSGRELVSYEARITKGIGKYQY